LDFGDKLGVQKEPNELKRVESESKNVIAGEMAVTEEIKRDWEFFGLKGKNKFARKIFAFFCFLFLFLFCFLLFFLFQRILQLIQKLPNSSRLSHLNTVYHQKFNSSFTHIPNHISNLDRNNNFVPDFSSLVSIFAPILSLLPHHSHCTRVLMQI